MNKMSQVLLYLARGILGGLLAGLCVGAWASGGDGVAVPQMSLAMLLHEGLAILASSVFVAAFMLALLLWLQARRLHNVREAGVSWLERLPPVLTLERILFAVLWVGFALLTVLVLSGMFFGELVWGRPLVLSHKVLLTLIAWLVFGVLLGGRKFAGWRGLTAVRATIFGFVLLFLAYAGTHFVMDVVLKR